jgi:hypothetical protein
VSVYRIKHHESFSFSVVDLTDGHTIYLSVLLRSYIIIYTDYANGSLGASGASIAVSVPLFILGCGIEFTPNHARCVPSEELVVNMVALPFCSNVTAAM